MPSGEELDNQQKDNALEKAKSYLESDKQKFVDAAKDERTVNNTVRHQYRVLSEAEKAQMILIKDVGLALLSSIDKLGSKREYSIAKTKVEEAVMWAVKGITG